MKTRAILLAAVLVAFVMPAWAQSPLPTAKPEDVGLSSQRLGRVAQMLKAQIELGRFPGAVVIVARKGKVAYFEAFGQRDPKAGAPMTKDAIFRLYSMTKPFTSVAVMILAEEGKLTLTDPVAKHLPQLAEMKVAVPKTDADGKTSYALVPRRDSDDNSGSPAPHVRDRVRRIHAEPVYQRGLHGEQGQLGRSNAGRTARAPRESPARASAGNGLGVQPVDRHPRPRG
jgi:hypothetical protein